MSPDDGIEPWWRQYLIPTLLSFAVAFSGWSVTQHFVIRNHDQAQELRLSTLELRLRDVEQHAAADETLRLQVVALDAKMQLMLVELGRVRDRLERLEARR